jgi:hypothetical protein
MDGDGALNCSATLAVRFERVTSEGAALRARTLSFFDEMPERRA